MSGGVNVRSRDSYRDSLSNALRRIDRSELTAPFFA